MGGNLTAVTENLYLFRDSCNVYVLRRGTEALLIDFGSGHVLEHLGEIGVEQVKAILHTHHHRDQAQGDREAARRGIPIHVPQHERHLFDQVEIYWSSKQLYDMYNVRNTYFTLTESVPVAGVLEDYGAFPFRAYELKVLPTPGHTSGSVTLLAQLDGVLVAFVGDLLHSPGKVATLFDLQYSYGSLDGVEASVLSLNQLEEHSPQVLCPSHGAVMKDAGVALSRTRDNLRSFYRLMSGGKLVADEFDLTPVASRLLHGTQACSSFYAILSRDGKRALFVDYGAPNFALFSPASIHFEAGERVRFLRHSLSRLKAQYGVERVEAVIPSHYHDDHINGIPYLQRQLGTEVWAYENMKEILEHPEGELIGCVLPDPIPVARTFKEGERFSWEGLEFEVHFTPGHCDYHMAMFTRIDGKRIAFSGDNVWPPEFVPSLIYRNHVHRTSHQLTARLYREHRPEVLCSGHGLFTNVVPDGYDLFLGNAERLSELFDTLLPKDSGILGVEPSWLQIYPYQIRGVAGKPIPVEVRVRNPLPAQAKVTFGWVLPEGWEASPNRGGLELAAGEQARLPFQLTLPAGRRFRYPKSAIALDVSLNGEPLGQITEAVVEHSPYGPAGA
jgi:glyoxylase-like metal-dependent hydrolase (beta-lactamase superfamily II)